MPELRTALVQQHRCEQHRRNPDRNVDEEDPRPAQVARQNPAQQDAGGGATAGGCPVDAEREVAIASFGEGGHEQRQRRRRKQRAAEPLYRAEADQRCF